MCVCVYVFLCVQVGVYMYEVEAKGQPWCCSSVAIPSSPCVSLSEACGDAYATAYVCEVRGQLWGVGSLLPQIRGCGVQTQVIRTVWQALPLPSHLSGTTLLFGKGAVVVTGGSEIQPREPLVSSAGVLRVRTTTPGLPVTKSKHGPYA